ncbi:MAG: hypothetical protein D6732_15790 [Methanobacteriota archaeon]|nr:MAG: hypothetical protein D6732_15790 [Euryarchaeota archaeon]
MAIPDGVDPLDQIYSVIPSKEVKKVLSYRFNFFRGFLFAFLFFQGIPYFLNYLEYRFVGYEALKKELNVATDKEVLAIILPRSIAGWGIACFFISLLGLLFTFFSARSPSVVYSRSYIPSGDLASKIEQDKDEVTANFFHPRYAFFHGALLQSIFQLVISTYLGMLVLTYF